MKQIKSNKFKNYFATSKLGIRIKSFIKSKINIKYLFEIRIRLLYMLACRQ